MIRNRHKELEVSVAEHFDLTALLAQVLDRLITLHKEVDSDDFKSLLQRELHSVQQLSYILGLHYAAHSSHVPDEVLD